MVNIGLDENEGSYKITKNDELAITIVYIFLVTMFCLGLWKLCEIAYWLGLNL